MLEWFLTALFVITLSSSFLTSIFIDFGSILWFVFAVVNAELVFMFGIKLNPYNKEIRKD